MFFFFGGTYYYTRCLASFFLFFFLMWAMKMLQGHLELGRCEHSKVNKPAPKKQEQECQEGDFWSTDEASPYGQHWCGHQDVAGPGHLRTVHQFNTARCKRRIKISTGTSTPQFISRVRFYMHKIIYGMNMILRI